MSVLVGSNQSLLNGLGAKLKADITDVSVRVMNGILEDFEFLSRRVLGLGLISHRNAVVFAVARQDVFVVGPFWRNANCLKLTFFFGIGHQGVQRNWSCQVCAGGSRCGSAGFQKSGQCGKRNTKRASTLQKLPPAMGSR